jgi:hypothetical protein
VVDGARSRHRQLGHHSSDGRQDVGLKIAAPIQKAADRLDAQLRFNIPLSRAMEPPTDFIAYLRALLQPSAVHTVARRPILVDARPANATLGHAPAPTGSFVAWRAAGSRRSQSAPERPRPWAQRANVGYAAIKERPIKERLGFGVPGW